MDAKLKAKWIKALLSGEYKQTDPSDGRLVLDGKYCCLGVLRHCANPNDVRAKRENEAVDPNAYLSRDQLREFGLTNAIQEQLAYVNDDAVPFDMIAGLIDEAL